MQKLIIIRGPSGAGKSAVARELLQRRTRPTLLVSEDQVRKMFSDHHRTGHSEGEKLSVAAVLFGLQNGYDVIYEGILNIKTTGRSLPDLIRSHKKSYLFYLDVSYEKTLRRHQTRPEKAEFKEEAIERWWEYASPTGHVSETVVPESSSLDDTIKTINRVADLGLEK